MKLSFLLVLHLQVYAILIRLCDAPQLFPQWFGGVFVSVVKHGFMFWRSSCIKCHFYLAVWNFGQHLLFLIWSKNEFHFYYITQSYIGRFLKRLWSKYQRLVIYIKAFTTLLQYNCALCLWMEQSLIQVDPWTRMKGSSTWSRECSHVQLVHCVHEDENSGFLRHMIGSAEL